MCVCVIFEKVARYNFLRLALSGRRMDLSRKQSAVEIFIEIFIAVVI